MSYTWEPRHPLREIAVNGKSIQVAHNIAEGLRYLSKYLQNDERNFLVWNDLLCIDQNDKADMERELKRMSFVYSHAYNVVSYVGLAEDNSQLVMRRFKEFEGLPDVVEPTNMLESLTEIEWIAFSKFLQRPYWRRMWVVQEMALCGYDPVLMCANKCAKVKALWWFVSLVIRHAPLCHRLLASALKEGDYFGEVRNETFSICARIHSIHTVRAALARHEPCDILKLLQICRSSLQQDARDKVYSILGLLPDHVSVLIEPDLNKSVHAVYQDLVVAVVKATKCLDILQNCLIDSEGLPTFPTWVPNIQIRSATHPLGSRPLINAGGDEVSKALFFEGDHLICQGVILDEVDHLTPPQWPLVPVSIEQHQQMEPTRPMNAIVNANEMLWRTFMGDRAAIDSEICAPEQYQCLLSLPWPQDNRYRDVELQAQYLIDQGWCTVNERQDLVTFLHFRERATYDFEVCGRPLVTFFPRSTDSDADQGNSEDQVLAEDDQTDSELQDQRSEWLSKALRQAAATLKRRRLIVTTQGYIGASVRECRKGDKIAVLQGCNVPIVLRPRVTKPEPTDEKRSLQYMVVGDCYVYGIMNGEALLPTSTRAQQSIVLS